ncbi:MAG: hypothetical protein ACUVTD_07365 [Nitrososphaerales archaeon]
MMTTEIFIILHRIKEVLKIGQEKALSLLATEIARKGFLSKILEKKNFSRVMCVRF